MTSELLIAIVALIPTIVVGYWQHGRGVSKGQKLSQQNDLLIKMSNQIQELIKKLSDMATTLTSKEDEIRILKEKHRKNTQEIRQRRDNEVQEYQATLLELKNLKTSLKKMISRLKPMVKKCPSITDTAYNELNRIESRI